MNYADLNSRAPWKRWPGADRPRLRVGMFVLFFVAFCMGVLSFVEYQTAIENATSIPTELHPIKVLQAGRALYFSAAEWRRIHLLELSCAGFAFLGLFLGLVSFVRMLRALLPRNGRITEEVWSALPSASSSASPSMAYGWFGVVVFVIVGLLMFFLVVWRFVYSFA